MEFIIRQITGTPYTDVAVCMGGTKVDLGFHDLAETESLAQDLEEAAEFLRDRAKAIREWNEED